ncbi:Grx4 family monothiol glutaredoxin [Polyangium jinanense]|uniref:Glutaredoxin n=1 Tax=Polyangium jinanense TaxID=2829994 RepID=A0A9X4AT00_9BACT|nr:Grx4 family monothiol glutaredoxin [Polyangium jinanense]MDC3958093.1 Grx4 family monothiol glutaredoxin [Polyangium jinanense]MDC3983708.1 Grx4 family monothiol glutaredoxin [Polyangium jinanense]
MSDVRQRIQEIIDQNRVVLFMKGTKSFPQCGFSQRAVQILKAAGAEFADVNVLKDPDIRQGIKEFSNWPTIPQVYIDGKFVGGSDILLEMQASGELAQLLTPKN